MLHLSINLTFHLFTKPVKFSKSHTFEQSRSSFDNLSLFYKNMSDMQANIKLGFSEPKFYIFKELNNSQTAAQSSLGTEFCYRLFQSIWSPSAFLFH